MGHRKWGHYAPIKGQASVRPTCIDEHNALYDAWVVEGNRAGDLLKDRNAIQGKLDEARKRIAELESPTRVPFSDDQIERMGAAALKASFTKNMSWTDIIRAALAAGGLEPCAVPTGHVLRDRLVEAERKVENQRAELNRLNAERDNYKSMLEEEVACGSEYLERAEALGCPKDGNINDAYAWALDQIATLRERVSVDPPADQVEALARVLHKSQDAFYCRYGDHATKFDDHTPLWSTMARAAIAHLSTRPERLPTADDLWRLICSIEEMQYDWKGIEYIELEQGDMSNLLTALRPWLRDPVGCELDIRPGMLRDSVALHSEESFLNWLRSRIRPVFECKECAGLKQRLHHAAVAWRKIRDDEASDALDAALEGE